MKFHAKMTASHYVLPGQILDNDDLAARFGLRKVKAISNLSGIYERRVCPKNITAVDLGGAAAGRMLDSLSIDRSDFDMLIFVSQTRDYILPPSAYVLHDRLKMPSSCGAFDLPLGCSAFPCAMGIANGLVASGQCKKILLILSDTITHLINPGDRGLVTLHGDGAAAFVLERSEDEFGFEFADMGSESSGWKYLIVPAGGMRTPSSNETRLEKTTPDGITTTDENLQMNGEAIFHFSITTVPGAVRKTLAKHNAEISSYDLVLFHQANKLMLDNIYNELGVDEKCRFFFMEKIGNLSAASSPVLLAEALRSGKLNSGGRLLLSAFGVGLSWAIFSMRFAPGGKISSKASTEL